MKDEKQHDAVNKQQVCVLDSSCLCCAKNWTHTPGSYGRSAGRQRSKQRSRSCSKICKSCSQGTMKATYRLDITDPGIIHDASTMELLHEVAVVGFQLLGGLLRCVSYIVNIQIILALPA